jgi:hypothetical protein
MVNSRNLRRMSAAVGASAVMAMCAFAAVSGSAHASSHPIIPEHYGGPVNTSIDAPSTMAGLPVNSAVASTSASTPAGDPAGG